MALLFGLFKRKSDRMIAFNFISSSSVNENVYIFDSEIRRYEFEDVDIYGYGFTDFYSKKVNLPIILDDSKINILIMHADLDGANKEYGDYRVYGYQDDDGTMIFDCFGKGLH